MKSTTILHLILLAAMFLTSCSSRHTYTDSPSIRLARLAQDSLINNAPQKAEEVLKEAKMKAQDSTEYYYTEAVYSSLLTSRTQDAEALKYIDRSVDFCLRQSEPNILHYEILVICENNRGGILQYANRSQEAAQAYQKAIRYCSLSKNGKGLSNIYNNLGSVYFTLNNLPMQAHCYRQALFVCDSLNLSEKLKTNSYIMLGHCYVQLKNYEQAKENLDKAYRMIDELPLYHRFFLLNTYVNLYYYQEKYEKSWEYLMKIFPDMEAQKGEMPGDFAILEGNYADLSIQLGKNLKEAEQHLNNAHRFFAASNNPVALYYTETLRLQLLMKQQKWTEVEKRVQQLQRQKDENIPVNYLQNRNKALMEYYRKNGQYEKAFLLLQQNAMTEDSIRSKEHKAYVAEQDLRYLNNTTNLNNQLTISTQQNKIVQLRLEIILGSIFLLGILIYLVNYRKRTQKRQQEQWERMTNEISRLKMQNIRKKVSPHFIFNVLNWEINKQTEAEEKTQRLLLLSKLLRKGLNLSEQISAPLSEELEFMQDYTLLQQQTGKKFQFTIETKGNIQPEKIRILSMVLQIPIENAIKHGVNGVKDGHISLLLEDRGKGIGIVIRNNGNTYTPFNNRPADSNGIGLKIIYQSIALLNERNKEKISFHLHGLPEGGTEVCIYVPYQYNFFERTNL